MKKNVSLRYLLLQHTFLFNLFLGRGGDKLESVNIHCLCTSGRRGEVLRDAPSSCLPKFGPSQQHLRLARTNCSPDPPPPFPRRRRRRQHAPARVSARRSLSFADGLVTSGQTRPLCFPLLPPLLSLSHSEDGVTLELLSSQGEGGETGEGAYL